MAVQIAMVAANVVLPFIKKHPWVVPVGIVGLLAPLLFLWGLIGAIFTGISEIKIPTVADYCAVSFTDNQQPIFSANATSIANMYMPGKVQACKEVYNYTGDGSWVNPLPEYKLGNPYGWRTLYGQADFHSGADFPAPEGTIIGAAAGGKVVASGQAPDGAYRVIIDHGDGVYTWYWHIVAGGLLVATGDLVQPGQPIGKVGSTGNSTGNHLHFQVQVKGQAVDPILFMLERGINMTQYGYTPGDLNATTGSYCYMSVRAAFAWC